MEYFKSRFVGELNDEGVIEIAGNVWTRHEVLEGMDRDAATDVFTNWVDDAKQAAIQRTREFLTETQCLPRFVTLSHRLANGNVVPFVGAGLSRASGFPLWGQFLESLVADAPALRTQLVVLLERGEYEEAAEVVRQARGSAVLAEDIHNTFGSHRKQVQGPVQLLPWVFRDEVLTTNFDYLLDQAYDDLGHPFRMSLAGPELRTAPARIGNNPHCLLRLHGQADTEHGRILTREEYDQAYSDDRTLSGVLGAITGLRSLLFMGCSLQTDRTVNALREIRQRAQIDPPRHYAFLPLPAEDQREARRQFLSEAEIHPIYYPADDHDQCIEDMLITLMEGGL